MHALTSLSKSLVSLAIKGFQKHLPLSLENVQKTERAYSLALM